MPNLFHLDQSNFGPLKGSKTAQWTTKPNQKYRNFGVSVISVRFGSVRLKNTKPKQIEEFRLITSSNYTLGQKFVKSLAQNLFMESFISFFCEIEHK